MANKTLLASLVLLGCATAALSATIKYAPISSKTSIPLPIGDLADKYFVNGAKNLSSLGPKVTNVHLSRYADPKWDSQYAGTPTFWMGVASGGCGYGNLLDSTKYPYLMGLSLSAGARKALGFTSSDGVGCGGCVRITCNDKYYCPLGATSAVATILDICPDTPGHSSGKQCHELQADMYIKGWEAATGNSSSNPEVILERVMCPDPLTNIQLMVMFNAGSYGFLKVHFQNVGGYGIIQDVHYSCKGSENGKVTTVKLVNTYGAVWQTDEKNAPKETANCMFTLTMPSGETLYTNWLGTLKKGEKEDYPFLQIADTGVQTKLASGILPSAAPVLSSNTTLNSNSTLLTSNTTLLNSTALAIANATATNATLSIAGRRLAL